MKIFENQFLLVHKAYAHGQSSHISKCNYKYGQNPISGIYCFGSQENEKNKTMLFKNINYDLDTQTSYHFDPLLDQVNPLSEER